MMKKVLLLIAIVFVLIQFIRPEKNIKILGSASYIGNQYTVSDTINAVLKKSCYDCHSNRTNYPWYSTIQPFAWWLHNHVKDGKRKLNFDEFLSYSVNKQDHKLEELIETQKEELMPLTSYTFLHGEAKLSKEERQQLINWAHELRSTIQKNPSFIKK